MSNSANQGQNGFTMVIVAAFVISAIVFSLLGNKEQVSSQPVAPNRNSFEHRYTTERFKQEGYSSSEAQQAADAVIRFHEAQKKR